MMLFVIIVLAILAAAFLWNYGLKLIGWLIVIGLVLYSIGTHHII